MPKNRNSRPVYSTEHGRLCPQCHRPIDACVCAADRARSTGDGIIRLQRETSGRGGKAVTVIRGLPLDDAQLKRLARELKQRCGVGGAVKGGEVEIQGDQRKTLKEELEKRGYRVKLAGG